MFTSELTLQHELHSLYNNHHSWLYKWLHHKLNNASDAADLAQDAFSRVIVFRQTNRLIDEPKAFLTCSAKGLVIDHWRRKKIEQAYFNTIVRLQELNPPSPEASFLILQALYQFDRMLCNMLARLREIILFAQLDGLSYQEIAERTRTSLATVKRHMRKAFVACLSVV